MSLSEDRLGLATDPNREASVKPFKTRAAYESAEYKVIDSDGKIEVREYPDLMLVAATTKLDSQGRDGSLMKLFSYISGANETKQKISMATPVFMGNDKDTNVQMEFVMPKEVATKRVPKPPANKLTFGGGS